MSKKVLTVDDSKAVRMILSRHLKQFGVEIVEAENGAVGLLRAKETMPNLILLDYNMPVMDGYSTLECLKKDPATKNIPVIMLTTEAVQETVLKLIKLGLRDYITKPFSREDFLKKVNKLLNLFEGDQVPPEQKASVAPAPGAPAPQPAARPRTISPKEFLPTMGDVHVLRFPAEADSTTEYFIDAMEARIPAELDLMAKEGFTQLVIQLSSLIISSPMAAKRLGLLVSYAQRLEISYRVVAYSERVKEAYRKATGMAVAETNRSLDDAVEAFHATAAAAR
jgi:CheY-like chemotaxis protein